MDKAKLIFHDFESILGQSSTSDVELIFGDDSYPAHKILLASKSPIFKELFDSNKSSRIEMTDIDASAVIEMLHFIYRGQILHQDTENVKRLLIAAEKFAITDLLQICESILCKNLTPENVIELLNFSESHRTEKLTSQALELLIKSSNLANDHAKLQTLSQKNLATVVVGMSKITDVKKMTELNQGNVKFNNYSSLF